jgi:hypothetical protein
MMTVSIPRISKGDHDDDGVPNDSPPQAAATCTSATTLLATRPCPGPCTFGDIRPRVAGLCAASLASSRNTLIADSIVAWFSKMPECPIAPDAYALSYLAYKRKNLFFNSRGGMAKRILATFRFKLCSMITSLIVLNRRRLTSTLSARDPAMFDRRVFSKGRMRPRSTSFHWDRHLASKNVDQRDPVLW